MFTKQGTGQTIHARRWQSSVLVLLTGIVLCAAAASTGQQAPAKTRHPYNDARQPWTIPGTIEAENFDEGTKEDPAYYELTPTNLAPADEIYRDSAVDIGVDTVEQLADVGWVDAGEWTEYTVDVKVTGTYSVATRIATIKSGKTFRLETDHSPITGWVVAPNTGCWGSDLKGHDCFQEVVVNDIHLQQGVHRLRFFGGGTPGDINLYTVDKFRFIRTSPSKQN